MIDHISYGTPTMAEATPIKTDDATATHDHPGAMEISEDSLHGAGSSHRTLGVLPLAMLIFYGVAGGPFGTEETVRSAGPLYSILGFMIMPFVWSVPESLLTSELSSAYPEASGSVAWVEEAFGPAWGWMSGYLSWVSGATDNAIYPVMFLEYVLQIWKSEDDHISPTIRFLLLSCTSAILAYMNWLGLSFVGNMTTVIGVVALSPFLIMTLIGISKVDPQRWLIPAETDTVVDFDDDDGVGLLSISLGGIVWRNFLNNLFWNLNSFDSAACFAGDVHDPGRTLPRAMFWAVLMVGTGYLIPLMIALGATDAPQHEWVDGYLAVAASKIGGAWLGAWVVFSAGVNNVGMFQAELSSDAFQLLGMAERGFVPKIFAQRSRHGTPTYGILLGLGVIVIMGVANLDKLIEMLNFNYAISLLMEYCAFIKLRISKPNVHRPFRVPLGTVGCIILFTPPFIATLIIMGLASYGTLLFAFGTNVFGIFIYCMYRGPSARTFCDYSPIVNEVEEVDAQQFSFRDSKPEELTTHPIL